jgi:putative phosphoribosyl transferase
MSNAYRTFRDRIDAGRQLGARLRAANVGDDVVVLGLARGGIPVACEAAAAIGAPADVLVVRKIGAPFNPELAVGSIASGGITVFNHWILQTLGLDEADLAPIIEREERELHRREQAYRSDRALPDLQGKTVVLVDDGAATGATMHAGVEAVRTLDPRRVIVALPTSSVDAAERLRSVADEVIALSTPEPYFSVGSWYQSFGQVDDAEVAEWLGRCRQNDKPGTKGTESTESSQ